MAWLFRDRYMCQRLLGKGGFGQVWLAHDRHLDREVAVKLFAKGFPLTDAFLEAQLLTELQGEHILQVLNADVYVDVPYVVTVVAAGGSAEDQMAPLGISPALAIRWIMQLLVGLDVVHQRSLVHRDVKPSNLFLETRDHARLGDFGIASRASGTGAVPIHGDWRIVSPEMFASGTGTAVSDIYSAGTTLYSLLAGAYPITGTPAEIQRAAQAGDYDPLRDVAPHVPSRLASRVRRAMAIDPADRFSSAREMRESLAAIGLVRDWFRTPPHPGHERCWSSAGSRATTPLTVCVIASGRGGYDIETRSASGTGRRIRPACTYVPTQRLLATRLRGVFGML